MNDITVVYYTSNRELPEFEKKIQAILKRNMGDLPLISVSQKPMDFGTNICVGNVGFSDHNGIRQMYMGALEAKTKYVLAAESDFLYPPDYFNFTPSEEDCYKYDNIWILYSNPKYHDFQKKRFSEGATLYLREMLIEKYAKWLENMPIWWDGWQERRKAPFHKYPFKTFGTKNPCISFKTGNGMRRFTNTMKDIPHQSELPYWGSADYLRKGFAYEEY